MQFGGYQMPIEYTGILREHEAVRTDVGMFDVSHMGEFRVEGPGAAGFLDRLVTNWPSRLTVGQALYTPMCRPDGGTVDDLLIYRLDDEVYELVVNAANRSGDWEWIREQAESFAGLALTDESDEIALIAVQGPRSIEVLQPLVDVSLENIATYHFSQEVRVGSHLAIVSRTGYTGEDGFELYVSSRDAESVWQRLVDLGVTPVGLGARDTLRLEARLPLYGHELSDNITPLEAGLSPFIKWDKGDFIGKDALWQQKSGGLSRKIVGLQLDGGIARAGMAVHDGEQTVGVVTSGSHSPTLKVPIALALLDMPWTKVGQNLRVAVRGRLVSATVVRTPFYKKGAKDA